MPCQQRLTLEVRCGRRLGEGQPAVDNGDLACRPSRVLLAGDTPCTYAASGSERASISPSATERDELTMTQAPSLANRSATARPMPLDEPVTTTTTLTRSADPTAQPQRQLAEIRTDAPSAAPIRGTFPHTRPAECDPLSPVDIVRSGTKTLGRAGAMWRRAVRRFPARRDRYGRARLEPACRSGCRAGVGHRAGCRRNHPPGSA
jgi:hypothetical protein